MGMSFFGNEKGEKLNYSYRRYIRVLMDMIITKEDTYAETVF